MTPNASPVQGFTLGNVRAPAEPRCSPLMKFMTSALALSSRAVLVLDMLEALGHDAEEAFVELTIVVEDRLADLVRIPGDHRVVRIGVVTARKHFRAIA